MISLVLNGGNSKTNNMLILQDFPQFSMKQQTKGKRSEIEQVYAAFALRRWHLDRKLTNIHSFI